MPQRYKKSKDKSLKIKDFFSYTSHVNVIYNKMMSILCDSATL